MAREVKPAAAVLTIALHDRVTHHVTIRQFNCLVAVAEAGSFTMAAHRLALAQPALTATIQKLESELGVRLFDRSARRVGLTEAGRDLLPMAERLLRDIDGTVEDIRGFAHGSRGISAWSPRLRPSRRSCCRPSRFSSATTPRCA
jgi:DNA-binding MarR family transcriptional regulator